MNTHLKEQIVYQVQCNAKDFQLVKFITDQFKAYIYDAQGNYLIGGKEVENFIKDFINLYTN